MRLSIIFTIISLFCTRAMAFIGIDDVVKELNYLDETNIIKVESLNPKTTEIKNNLLPLESLIPEELQKKLDMAKEEHGFLFKVRKFIRTGIGIDLREFDNGIRKQWNGTCTAFGLAATMENLLNRKEAEKFSKLKYDLSERDMWSKYRTYSAFSAVAAMENNNICEEKYWNQDSVGPNGLSCLINRNFKLKGKTEALGDDVEKAISALLSKYPVYIAMSTPAQMYQCKKVISKKSGRTRYGHALAVVGFKFDYRIESGGYFILKNSWGSDCGDGGYQYLDYDYCNMKGNYCLMWKIDNAIDEKKPTN